MINVRGEGRSGGEEVIDCQIVKENAHCTGRCETEPEPWRETYQPEVFVAGWRIWVQRLPYLKRSGLIKPSEDGNTGLKSGLQRWKMKSGLLKMLLHFVYYQYGHVFFKESWDSNYGIAFIKTQLCHVSISAQSNTF